MAKINKAYAYDLFCGSEELLIEWGRWFLGLRTDARCDEDNLYEFVVDFIETKERNGRKAGMIERIYDWMKDKEPAKLLEWMENEDEAAEEDWRGGIEE